MMKDLMLLCRDCHKLVHSFHGQNIWANSLRLKKSRGVVGKSYRLESETIGPKGGERPPWE
jgi:hypothetical protein